MRRLYPAAGEIDPVDAYGRLAAPVPSRPGVRLNMIASVDGASSLHGRSGALGGPADKSLFAVLRSLADVILVGAGTMRAESYGAVRLDTTARAWRCAEGLPPVPPIAVVTRTCRLDWTSPFFIESEQRAVVVTVVSADAADRAHAAEVADVIVAGDEEVDVAGVVRALGERGHHDVLAEGGPVVAAQLAAAEVLDELCLTVSPMLTAGDARRILDGPALLRPVGLELAHVLEADDHLFLRYRRK